MGTLAKLLKKDLRLGITKGIIKSLTTYKNGEYHGISFNRWENGFTIANYFEGKKQGEDEYFDIKGNKINHSDFWSRRTKA